MQRGITYNADIPIGKIINALKVSNSQIVTVLLLIFDNSNTFNTFVMKKVSGVLRILRDDGWYIHRIKGSHRQLRHPKKPGVITLSGKMSDDIPKGTLGSVLRKAGLKHKC